GVSIQEGRPGAALRRISADALPESREIVGGPAWAAIIEIKDRERSIVGHVDVPPVKVTVTKPLCQLAGTRNQMPTEAVGQRAKIDPLLGPVREIKLDPPKKLLE